MTYPTTGTGFTRSLRILLIDDEPMVCEVLKEILTAEGHETETAGNGEEGLEKYGSGAFDLVITDMSMPGMKGDEVAQAIKEKNPQQPIILMTGYVTESIEAMIKNPNTISLVVSKPVKHSELKKALEYIHSHQF